MLKRMWNHCTEGWGTYAEAIDEVGCIHSIQGYDLNYAFVILGKDIGYDKAAGRIFVSVHGSGEIKMKQETIDRIRKFTEDRDWDQFHSPANLAKSIVIEAAELLECFQWSDEEYDLQHIKEELADVMVYSQNLLDKQLGCRRNH